MFIVIDNDIINDMMDNNLNMINLADYDAAIAMDLAAAYKIADKFINEQDVSQAIIMPLVGDKVLAATMRPVHEVLCWPEDEQEPSLPEIIDPDCEDCE